VAGAETGGDPPILALDVMGDGGSGPGQQRGRPAPNRPGRDFIGSIDPRSTRQVMDAKGFNVLATKSGNYTDLVMRMGGRPATTRISSWA